MSSHYTRGEQLYNLGKYKEALKLFKDSLTEDPDDFYAKYHLALCYYHLDKIELLKVTSQSLLSNYPDSDEAHYLYSIYFFEVDDYETSIKHINKAIEIEPYEAVYFGQKAICLINKKNFKEALKYANQGLSINPKEPICLNSRTTALTKLNRKEEAYESLQNTLSENPEDYFTHANAGWTNLELGKHKQANIHFKEALQKDPNNKYAREGMLESIKAKNFVYRTFLKYAFWIRNKNSNFQWGFIIGLYLLYRFSSRLINNLGYDFLIPIIAILYFVFVLGSWIITPASNSILLFNNYSKYLLNTKDKIAAITFISLLSISLINITGYYVLNIESLLFLGISSLSSIIPLTHSIQVSKKPLKNLAFLYGIIIFITGIYNLIYPGNISFIVPIIMFAIYTWTHEFLNQER